MKIVAFLDSCVLYPFTLRDILIQFSIDGMFRAKWSSKVQHEVVKNVEKNNSTTKGKLSRTFSIMEQIIPDFSAEPTLQTRQEVRASKTDKNDVDILAGAIDGDYNHLVTSNLRHFDSTFAFTRGITIIHPDNFLEELIHKNPSLAESGFNKILVRYKNPPRTKQQYCSVLRNNQLKKTSTALENL